MKAAREAAGLSQYELAELSGVNRLAIGQIERGQREYGPRLDTAIMLADALGISIDEYVGHIPRKG